VEFTNFVQNDLGIFFSSNTLGYFKHHLILMLYQTILLGWVTISSFLMPNLFQNLLILTKLYFPPPSIFKGFNFYLVWIQSIVGRTNHNCHFFQSWMNWKCEIIFHNNIVNFSEIHITIEFLDNHIKNYEWILRKEWTHSERLNQWHFLGHKIKKLTCGFKKYAMVGSKISEKNRTTSNDVFKNKMHWNFLYNFSVLCI
jgi:SNF family Na+-dependent transporter